VDHADEGGDVNEPKRLLDEGSDLDRLLLSAGMDEAPPPRALERTLAAIGVGTAVGVGGGAAAGSAALAAEAAAGAGAGAGAAGSGWLGAGVAKIVLGLAVAGSAVGGGYFMAAHEAEERARVELAGGAANDRLGSATSGADGPVPLVVLTSSASGRTSPRSESAPGRIDGAPPRALGSAGALGGEVELLDQARRALLAGDPSACLARLAAYDSRFPQGQLKAEASELRQRALAASK
jgi:hypothetical protein